MKTQAIEYFDGKQKLIGELVYDGDLTHQKSAIIVFPAFEGRGAFAVDYAKKLAGKGYIAFVVADIYGDAVVTNTIEGCFKLITPFLQDRQLVRTRSVLGGPDANPRNFRSVFSHKLTLPI